MTNAKLKEQIEAAKIAFVHSAEAGSHADPSATASTVSQIPNIGTDHAQLHVNSVAEMPRSPANAETPTIGRETTAQSDYEKLEARLQGLENQIKNQQRDLHTLLQKLREINAKSQAVAKPKESKSTKKWLAGAALCMIGLSAGYYWLGADVITGVIYQAAGLMVAFIDMMAGKI